jgi:hypothetical protein
MEPLGGTGSGRIFAPGEERGAAPGDPLAIAG